MNFSTCGADMARTGAYPSTSRCPEGRRLWTFQPARFFWHAPAIGDGILYAGSDDGSVYGIGKSDGPLRWQARIADETDSGATVAGDLVLISARDGCLHALDARAGGGLWQAGPYWSILSAACADAGQAVVACYDGGVRAL